MSHTVEVYLDTSIPNAYLDNTKPERQRETIDFWGRMHEYDIFISDFVLKEINQTKQAKRRDDLLRLVYPFKVLNGERDDVKEMV